ncbi:competence/damage-inducible protein A [Acetobacteraceae bacterium]|nr:competence/damage-inducible protein A [Acetobacteraceae bacterium]
MRNTKIPRACFLIIGDEILSGRTIEKNLPVLAQLLNQHGIRLTEVRIIPDQKTHIIQAITTCRAAYDEIFTSGGIGPTHDDKTTISVAEAFDLPLRRHEPTFKLLKQNSKNGECNKMAEKMAWLPQGSRPIENSLSAPPGFSIGNVHVMAGVPNIFKSMAEWLIPKLPKGLPLHSMAWHSFDLGESEFAEDLEQLQKDFPNTELGSYPFCHNGKYGVTLVAKGHYLESVEMAAAAFPEIFKKYSAIPQQGEFQV